MKATYIDYKDTQSFSSTVIRYLDRDPQLQRFISAPPTIEGFKEIINSKGAATVNRQVLTDVLTEQYSRLKTAQSFPHVQANIEKLRSANTYTVTTGHQLNIFTGPLYFIYKIATAIKLAADLKREFPDKDFVPVYWMATEDHDFEEINHTTIGGKSICWNKETSGATGRIDTTDLRNALSEYKAILGISDHAERLSTLADEAYKKHSTLADATRYLVNGLFADHGLVIIDADQREFKKQFAPIIRQDIISQNSYRQIIATIKELAGTGVAAQVNPREINFFYLFDHLRERLVFENGRFVVMNSEISFSAEELEQEIHQFPERFSPNVVMRPLYQEIILPNIAYIGGGAEVVYWLQLKSTFDFYGILFPILVLRNSAMIATDNLLSRLKRLDLKYQDLFTAFEELKKGWVLNHTKNTLDLKAEWNDLQSTFEKIKSKAEIIDKTLGPSSEAVKARLHRAILNLERKLLKAEKRNYATALKQIEAVKDQHFPKGGLQERSENFGLFYAKHGQQFIDELVRHFEPLEFKFTILETE